MSFVLMYDDITLRYLYSIIIGYVSNYITKRDIYYSMYIITNCDILERIEINSSF